MAAAYSAESRPFPLLPDSRLALALSFYVAPDGVGNVEEFHDVEGRFSSLLDIHLHANWCDAPLRF